MFTVGVICYSRFVERLGRRQVSVGPASLYESIHTLRARGLIAEADTPEGADRRRRSSSRARDAPFSRLKPSASACS